jgi:WD40 repeat protein
MLLLIWHASAAPRNHSDAWVREYLAASFSSDGRLVVGGVDDTARSFEVATVREVVRPLRHDNWVRAVAFGPDNRRVLTGSHDMTARLWAATTGEPLTPPLRHSGEVIAVAISPDVRTPSGPGGQIR